MLQQPALPLPSSEEPQPAPRPVLIINLNSREYAEIASRLDDPWHCEVGDCSNSADRGVALETGGRGGFMYQCDKHLREGEETAIRRALEWLYAR